jgi:hypothetical protein
MRFRSDHKAVIDAFTELNATFRAWVEGPVHDFQDEISEANGSPLHVTDVRQYEDGLDTVRIIGTPDDPGDNKAWRRGNKIDSPVFANADIKIWVPDKANRAGRTWERKMAKLYWRVPPMPGMPERWIDPVGMKMYRPTYEETKDVDDRLFEVVAIWGDGVAGMIVDGVYWDPVDD